MGDVAIGCSDAAEQIEEGHVLAALGALSHCAERIRNTMVIVRAAHEWQQKLLQTAIPLQPQKEEQS
jgi:hypothetical protein